MHLNKLELIILFVGVASSMTFHFIGSLIFYTGAFMHVFRYGKPQVEFVALFYGVIVLVVGLVIALFVGKILKGKILTGISIAYLTVATSSIYLIFSKAYPDRILSPFLPHIFLSNSTLCIVWFIGYFRKKRSKRLDEREYPV